MNKQELVMETLKQLGYRPSIDADGDVKFRHKMRTYYAQIEGEQDEEHPFLSLLLPNFVKLDEEHIPTVLIICNNAARKLKVVKLSLDEDLSHVNASCEFYYRDPESLRENIEISMKILPLIPIWFRDRYQEFTE